MARTRRNERYLPGITIPDAVKITAELPSADLFLVATPVSGLREVTNKVAGPVVWLCKGFERDTGLLPHQIVEQPRCGALSGPSFADEVARGLPCALTLASRDAAFAREAAALLHGGRLRVYYSTDLVGVEVGGALKNVMAIAAGISDGLGLGHNARAALITRGLAEIARLGAAMGGQADTIFGLTGVGDLILTATGDLSRIYGLQRTYHDQTRGIIQAVYLRPLGENYGGLAAYYGDVVLWEPALIRMYDDVLPGIERELGK